MVWSKIVDPTIAIIRAMIPLNNTIETVFSLASIICLSIMITIVMKNNETKRHAHQGSPIYLWAKQNPVIPQIKKRITKAEVYLLNWERLASEHCANTSEFQPVSLHPNKTHQFIII